MTKATFITNYVFRVAVGSIRRLVCLYFEFIRKCHAQVHAKIILCRVETNYENEWCRWGWGTIRICLTVLVLLSLYYAKILARSLFKALPFSGVNPHSAIDMTIWSSKQIHFYCTSSNYWHCFSSWFDYVYVKHFIMTVWIIAYITVVPNVFSPKAD